MDLLRNHFRAIWLALGVSLFVLLAGFQLGLPGLHYDEAKEAGVNAMELLTGAPVTAFRGAALQIGNITLPLMVQDYIGALNVYLAIPFLALSGIGVPNLRMLGIFLGVMALLCLERAVSEWTLIQRSVQPPVLSKGSLGAPMAISALFTITLLAASPSFVFWNRQGIFVTNATLPATYFAIWQGIRWLRTGRERSLLAAAFAAGLALYAKLLAVWAIAPFVCLLLGGWIWRRRRAGSVTDPAAPPVPALGAGIAIRAVLAGLLPLVPLLLFNWQTGGTLQSIGGNLSQSYYGVDNADLLRNLPLRLEQLVQSLAGGQFWYLGGLHKNGFAPWLWLLVVGGALLLPKGRRQAGPPLLLVGAAMLLSLFTVSDLFITHYALIHPLAIATAGIALGAMVAGQQADPGQQATFRFTQRHIVICAIALLWLIGDGLATIGYHRDLARSGGLADHSDATYHLAYHLRYNGLGAPIALDWGMEAPVRFLSAGTVQPIEIFGYDSLVQPDEGFAQRLALFLENPENVYLLRAPGQTVFQGRREAFFAYVQQTAGEAVLERSFSQQDGTPLFELWRVRFPQ